MTYQLMMKLSLWLLLSSLSIALIADESSESQALEIVNELDKRDNGWGDYSASLEMTLLNKRGNKSTRDIDIKLLEMENDGDKSLSVFNQPRDVKGTAFLSFSHAITPDQQWLYLPALKRVKRISTANKSGPFMGSEFAYEDLSSFEIEKYSYDFIKNETLGDTECYLLTFTPKYEHSGYTYQRVWIDTAEYRIQKIEFYDRKKSLLKTLVFSNYNQYLNQYWRATNMHMTNHQTGKSTQLVYRDYNFRIGLTDSQFNSNGLKRAR